MKKEISALLILGILLTAVFAQEELFGTVIYQTSYNAKVDYDGYIWSDISKYSDLSTDNSIITKLYIFEKPNLAVSYIQNFTFLNPYGFNTTITDLDSFDSAYEEGLINATISYQYANGTNAFERYSYYYNPFLFSNANPLTFFVRLGKGDIALVNVFKDNWPASAAYNNITRLNVVIASNAPVIEKKIFPNINDMVDKLNSIVNVEIDVFLILKTIFDFFVLIFFIFIAPVLIVLVFLWAIRKLREGVTK